MPYIIRPNILPWNELESKKLIKEKEEFLKKKVEAVEAEAEKEAEVEAEAEKESEVEAEVEAEKTESKSTRSKKAGDK